MSYLFFGLGCLFGVVFCGALFWEWWQDHKNL
jgi:hypothetical protein